MPKENLTRAQARLEQSGYDLQQHFDEQRQQWRATVSDPDGRVLVESSDAVETTALGVALIKAMQFGLP
jgi:hypothetical protein